MPVYLLECLSCKRTEEKMYTKIVRFLTVEEINAKKTKTKNKKKKAGFRVVERTKPPIHYPKCGHCGGNQVLLPSLTAMQPDKYWSGQVVHGKYVTKKSQVNQDIVPATRDRMEYVKKREGQVKKEEKEKQDKNLKRFLTEELAGVNI